MKIGILGTGAYGLSLATVLKRNGHTLTMWTKFEEEKSLLEKNRGNEKLLPGIHFEDDIEFTCDIEKACLEKDLIIIAVPIAFFESTVEKIANIVDKQTSICIATKGIEQNNGLFAHELLQKYIDTNKFAVLSGPTFAIDLAKDTICALTIATKDNETLEKMKKAFVSRHVRLETCDDVVGVELCGSIKNIMAIATGIIDGIGQSDSTKAYFENRALHEMMHLIESLGGKGNTILTLAGIGDFILTCNSIKSRNYTYGIKLGSKSKDLEQYEKDTTIEGLYTLKSLYQLLERTACPTPLINVIHNICVKKENPENLLTVLVEI